MRSPQAERPLARLVSIAGHPAVLMPVAAVVASPGPVAATALMVALALAAFAVGYSLYRTRRGEWSHVDASLPAERADFGWRLGPGLLLASGLLALAGLHAGIPLVVGISGLIVVAGLLFRRVAKLSLHVAFAVFATCLVWPHTVAAAGLAVVALAVAWSRLALRRHVVADVLLGAFAGAAGGLAFHVAMARIPA